ncbi:MAG: hypothetical protein HOH88_04455 [Flavobacteriales bacterium]|nr:hypothetical protein [Flavobacteriales bacterium]
MKKLVIIIFLLSPFLPLSADSKEKAVSEETQKKAPKGLKSDDIATSNTIDGCSGPATFTHVYDPVLNCYTFTNTTNNDCGTDGICTWDFGDGSPTVTTIQGANTICHEFPDCDTYNISLTYDATACFSTAICFGSYQVDINTFVPDNIDIYTSDCNGYNISCFGGSDGFIQINSLPPLCTVQWDDGTVGLYNGNLSAGVHGATIEDDQGCNYLFFDTLTEPPPITSNIQIVSNNYNGYDLRCYGDSTAIIDVTSTGGVLPYTYLWNNGEITHQISNLPSDLYSVNITDACGCFSNADIGLIQPDVLEIISSNSKDSCGRGVANAEVEILGGIQPYEYLWSNNETAQLVTNLYEGSYTVLVTDKNNCSISDQIIIENVPDPIADFRIVPSLKLHHFSEQIDNPIYFLDESQDDFTTIVDWVWGFEDGYNSNLQNVEHSFDEIGSFNVLLIIKNLFGCIDTITKRVIIEDFVLYIPNSFTPDGDGINDSFLPKGMGVKKYKLDIFNRWGALIFSSNHLSGNEEYCMHNQQDVIGWDGTTYNSERISQLGVYRYLINLEDVFGMPHQYMGQITLIR